MRKRIVSCAMAFLMAFTLMPCAAFAGEASAEGQVESLEAEKPAEDDAFGEGGLDEAFFAEDEDSLIGTLEADEESAAFAVSAVTGIYLDQTHGNDANDGLTKDTAVRTLEKANELANANGTRDIFLASVYQVTGTENWDLGGKTIHRYKLGGYMIELKDASASLTLKDVVIDGAEYSVAAENAAETDSIIKAASGGTIELKSGAILENNKAAQFGSGILAINGVEITMEDGAVIRNNTNRNYELGGGILLGNGSTFTMNGGEISGNTANGGGTYTMTGGVIKDNNNSLTEEARLSTRGDGVYVGTAFNLGGAAEISTNNDVYLKEGASVAKEGRYINVISSYTGASTAKPIQIHSEDVTVEGAEIGTQLVRYTAVAGGEAAAAQADANGIFVPSWKMQKGLVIGQSKAAGKTDWMTYVPSIRIQYQWVSTDNPSDVTPPADDYIRTGTAYTAKAQEATHQGYSFKGWFTDDACTLSYTDGTVLSTDTILYGKWEKIATPPSSGGGGSHVTKYYILHYESNGGTKYEDEKYKKNTVVILDKIPKRVGYTFTGWYADKELTDKITSVKMTSDKTVYAGWKATDVPETLNSDNHFAYIVGYEDGLVRPNADITRAEVAAIFFRLLKDDVRDDNLTANSVFTDVAFGKWYNKSISTMAKIGIVKGRTANAFAPNAPITRAEFAAICSRFDRSNVEIKSDFNDISGHWAEKEIRRAASLGWIKGYADGSFKPDQNITRAEAASMINRMLHRLPETADDLLDGMIQWPDNQPSDWYYINMQEATNSHDFKQKGEINEYWTKLTENPNWDRYK